MMETHPECECGRPITRRGSSGLPPPKCRQCMKEWAAGELGIDLGAVADPPV